MTDNTLQLDQLIPDETFTGTFEHESLAQILAKLHQGRATGALRSHSTEGINSLFFKDGVPVGVSTLTESAPLGMLLLEAGMISREQYDEGEQHVIYLSRVPEQVYRDMGVLSPEREQQLGFIQGLRRTHTFLITCRQSYEWGQGISFLVGFSSTVLPMDYLIITALALAFETHHREAYLQQFGTRQVLSADGLVAPFSMYGFGENEEKVVDSMREWRSIDELERWGIVTRHQLALILRALELLGRLQVRIRPELSSPRIRIAELEAETADLTPQMGWKSPSTVKRDHEIEPRPSVVVDLGDDKN